ncbi:hypothetical protein L596_025956 [Steinernema carpocapsae]|uniref:Uncharacterized protein n=1 Tax=Steinernema carpocapsae TaxID=34508 RepID=A0A4U5M999_STECR|nr:hypothetical protein L596_025956 [Steinernema carpocapsae]
MCLTRVGLRVKIKREETALGPGHRFLERKAIVPEMEATVGRIITRPGTTMRRSRVRRLEPEEYPPRTPEQLVSEHITQKQRTCYLGGCGGGRKIDPTDYGRLRRGRTEWYGDSNQKESRLPKTQICRGFLKPFPKRLDKAVQKPLPDLKRSRPPTNTPATVSRSAQGPSPLPEASPQPDVPESTAEEVHQVRQRRHPHSDEPPDSRIAPVSPRLKR